MGDVDYLMEVIDWDKNVDPDFAENPFMRPKPVRPLADEMEAEGYRREAGSATAPTPSAPRS